ncbi:hypothetical protein DFH11DRAFT_470120 [Phellopilus nigrolimitatus]|nr:hypothetical protein DFH11DRAFT_470120 [Phellopilus nigrolimitatus]
MTTQTVPRNAALCDLCQKKPKFSSHNYCGKNCASQAASLCDFCHQKPKFAGHSFCSKNCGSQAARSQGFGAGANANTGKGRGAVGKKGQNVGGMQGPHPGQLLNAVAQILPHVTPQGKAGQIVGAAVQLLPHVQAMFQPQGAQGGQAAVVHSAPMAAPRGGGRGQHAQAPPLINTTNPQVVPGAFQAPVQPVASACCRIPGCQQPAHVDMNDGQMSNYCSMLHREEAVQLGLADACIMCLKMPQGGDDHFCGRACREEALSSPA